MICVKNVASLVSTNTNLNKTVSTNTKLNKKVLPSRDWDASMDSSPVLPDTRIRGGFHRDFGEYT